MKNKAFTVCMFAGSRSGGNKLIETEAKKFGQALTRFNINVVFGGGGSGIMSAISQGVQEGSGDIIGIIPEFLIEKEKMDKSTSNLIITKNMHERKHMMYKKSSAFVIMPGGLGTLEEASEILAWKQLKLHKKTIIFMNINDFWSPFFLLLDHLSNSGFLRKEAFTTFKVAKNSQEALTILLDSKRKAS